MGAQTPGDDGRQRRHLRLEAQPAVVDGAVIAYAADGVYAFGPDPD